MLPTQTRDQSARVKRFQPKSPALAGEADEGGGGGRGARPGKDQVSKSPVASEGFDFHHQAMKSVSGVLARRTQIERHVRGESKLIERLIGRHPLFSGMNEQEGSAGRGVPSDLGENRPDAQELAARPGQPGDSGPGAFHAGGRSANMSSR